MSEQEEKSRLPYYAKLHFLMKLIGMTDAYAYRKLGPKWKQWKPFHVERLKADARAYCRKIEYHSSEPEIIELGKEVAAIIQELIRMINKEGEAELNWLRNYLSKERKSSDVKKACEAEGLDFRVICKRANELGVEKYQTSGARGRVRMWRLPEEKEDEEDE